MFDTAIMCLCIVSFYHMCCGDEVHAICQLRIYGPGKCYGAERGPSGGYPLASPLGQMWLPAGSVVCSEIVSDSVPGTSKAGVNISELKEVVQRSMEDGKVALRKGKNRYDVRTRIIGIFRWWDSFQP